MHSLETVIFNNKYIKKKHIGDEALITGWLILSETNSVPEEVLTESTNKKSK